MSKEMEDWFRKHRKSAIAQKPPAANRMARMIGGNGHADNFSSTGGSLTPNKINYGFGTINVTFAAGVNKDFVGFTDTTTVETPGGADLRCAKTERQTSIFYDVLCSCQITVSLTNDDDTVAGRFEFPTSLFKFGVYNYRTDAATPAVVSNTAVDSLLTAAEHTIRLPYSSFSQNLVNTFSVVWFSRTVGPTYGVPPVERLFVVPVVSWTTNAAEEYGGGPSISLGGIGAASATIDRMRMDITRHVP